MNTARVCRLQQITEQQITEELFEGGGQYCRHI